jgi:hypothetical protein
VRNRSRDRYSNRSRDRSRDHYSDRSRDRYRNRSRDRYSDSDSDSDSLTDSNSIYSDKLFDIINNENQSTNKPPTLDELQKDGFVQDSHYINDNNELNDEDKKRELLFKFELLKKSYKNAEIPEFSVHTDYKTIENTYEDTLRRLSLDSTVENYKTFLIGGFMATEYALGFFLKFHMNSY